MEMTSRHMKLALATGLVAILLALSVVNVRADVCGLDEPKPVRVEAGGFPAWAVRPVAPAIRFDPSLDPHATTIAATPLDFRLASRSVKAGQTLSIAVLVNVAEVDRFEALTVEREGAVLTIAGVMRRDESQPDLLVGQLRVAEGRIAAPEPGLYTVRMLAEPRWDYSVDPPRWIRPVVEAPLTVVP